MEITPGNIMLVSAVLLLFSVLAGKAGSRYGMPALLAFLGIGMLAGADGFYTELVGRRAETAS